MFGDVKIRAEAVIIADPKKLLRDIDALLLLPNNTPAINKTIYALRDLVQNATQTEYVQTSVDVEHLNRFSGNDLIDYVTDELRHSLGEHLVRVVSPVVIVIRED